jgi:hypothetical protein
VNNQGGSEGAQMAIASVEEGIRVTANMVYVGRQVHMGSEGLDHDIECVGGDQ